MHHEIERRFANGGALPDSLEGVQRNGTRVKRNAIAWAMHDLVVRRVIEPSSGKSKVILRAA